MNKVDNEIRRVQAMLPPGVPLDGVVISALVFFLSPKGDRIRNTVIVGGAHWLIHQAICTDKPDVNPFSPSFGHGNGHRGPVFSPLDGRYVEYQQ